MLVPTWLIVTIGILIGFPLACYLLLCMYIGALYVYYSN